MASMFAQPGNGTLFLGGQKVSGADIRDQNGRLPQSRTATCSCSKLEAPC